jgi:FtsZ-binding cell division protein ZapB
MCVPCKPCEGLIPDPTKPGDGGGDVLPSPGCSSDTLRAQLEDNRKLLIAKQSEKARIDVEIKASQDRDKDLSTLISGFDAIIDKYKAERQKLVRREDCLKAFYREMSRIFHDPQRFPPGCNEQLQAAINRQLCESERAKCCQKNLEWKLAKDTRLIWRQKEAENAFKQAEDAFAQIKDLPKWMGDQFTALEKLKDDIAKAINDKDPQAQKWAFYLFFWKFAPTLCKRFKVAICCEKLEGAYAATPTAHIGCTPGDWQPSKISEDTLKKLICCAWDYVKEKKADFHQATADVDTTKQNLDSIKEKIKADEKGLEDRINSELQKVLCVPAGCG